MRQLFPFLASLLVAACATTSTSPATSDSGTTPAPEAEGGDAASPDASGESALAACLTEVPCSSDTQCVALAGTSCNTKLVAPRCQTEQCGPQGTPCSSTGQCAVGMVCTDDVCTAGATEGDAGTTCVVKRAAKSSGCAENCDARLILPGGGYHCSFQCTLDTDCARADLICPATIGACVPRCTDDASCKAGGFARCDKDVGGCDTL